MSRRDLTIAVVVGVMLTTLLLAGRMYGREIPGVMWFFSIVNWPLDAAVESYVRAFLNGAMDQFIPQYMMLWFLYSVVIGFGAAFLVVGLTSRELRRRRQEGSIEEGGHH